MVTIGRRPEPLTVYFTPGDPFVCVMRRRDETGQPISWSAPPVLEFDSGPTWTATVSGADASWAVPDVDVDAAMRACPTRRVRLTLGGVVWAAGSYVAVG